MNLAELLASPYIIFAALAGSQAYGTQTPESDEDIRGIFVLPPRLRATLDDPPEEVSDEGQNTKYYELRKFVRLAAACNPNLIEMLWTPDDCVRVRTPAAELLSAHRRLFISAQAAETFSGYAYAQVRKARGQNKMVNNPQPEDRPRKEDFCWFVPVPGVAGSTGTPAADAALPPCRPIPLRQAGLDLRWFHVALLEHTSSTYRLYEYGESARGVFRNGMLVCEPIPLADERSRFRGLLIYNEPHYERALRDWHTYWDWVRNRNPDRWVTQEAGVVDYDPKNLMHCVRLLYSGLHILRDGEPLVRFTGERLDYLRAIRAGRLTYEAIMVEVERLMAEVTAARETCRLPRQPDRARLEQLFQDVLALAAA